MSRQWHAEKLPSGIAIGESSYHSRRVIMINPDQRGFYTTGYNRNRRGYGAYVLWFGGCGTTYLHVYADGLESALEECAAWLAEHAPGYIMPFGGEEHTALVREACEDHDLPFDPDKLCGVIDSDYDDVLQDAEADLTYTESGFLTSYEWGIALENPTAEILYRFIQGE